MTAGKIDNRKSPHTDGGRALNHHALIVRSAMCDRAAHALEYLVRLACIAMLIRGHKSGNATHLRYSVQAVETRAEIISSQIVSMEISVKEAPAIKTYFFASFVDRSVSQCLESTKHRFINSYVLAVPG